MERWVLTTDSRSDRFEMMQIEWIKYHAYVQMAPDMIKAMEHLLRREYLLVTIAGETVEYMPYLNLMRGLQSMPILVLAPKYNAAEKIEALRLGADEYIEWPPTAEERLASAKTLIRRYTELNNKKARRVESHTYKDLLLVVEYHKVFVRGKEITLTKGDFDLLQLLMEHPVQVYSVEQIYSRLSGDNEDYLLGTVTNSIRSRINRVRKKLRIETDSPDYIQTVRDVGYSLKVDFEVLEKSGFYSI